MAPNTQECVLCSDNFIVNNKCIQCDLCEKRYHLSCAKIKDQLMRFLLDCDNLNWFCNNCMPEVRLRIKTPRTEKIDEVLHKTEELINLIQNGEFKPNKSSWADVVKHKKIEPLIIKPKEANQNNTLTTKNVLAQKISPADLNVSISEIKQGNQGRITIHCENRNSLQKLKETVVKEMGDEYDVKVGNLSKPRIKLINVNPADLTNSVEFLNMFKQQNIPNEIVSSDIKIIHKFKSPKNRGTNVNVIVEMSPKEFNYLFSNKDRIFIGWNSYRFFEFVSVVRCFRCWRFGHFADKCQSERETCPLCSDGHKKAQCTSGDEYKCSNCVYARDILKLKNIQVNHHVFDLNCPCYQRQIAMTKKKTDYTV